MMASIPKRALRDAGARIRDTSQHRYTSWIAFEKPNPALYKTALLPGAEDKSSSPTVVAGAAGPSDAQHVVKPATTATAATTTATTPADTNPAATSAPFPVQTSHARTAANGMRAGAVRVPSQVRVKASTARTKAVTPWRDEHLPTLRIKLADTPATWDCSMATWAPQLAEEKIKKRQQMAFEDGGYADSDRSKTTQVEARRGHPASRNITDEASVAEAEQALQEVPEEGREAAIRRQNELLDVNSV